MEPGQTSRLVKDKKPRSDNVIAEIERGTYGTWRLWELGLLLMAMDYASCHGQQSLDWQKVSQILVETMPKIREQTKGDRNSIRTTWDWGDEAECWSALHCQRAWENPTDADDKDVLCKLPAVVKEAKEELKLWVVGKLMDYKTHKDYGISELVGLVDMNHLLPGEPGYPWKERRGNVLTEQDAREANEEGEKALRERRAAWRADKSWASSCNRCKDQHGKQVENEVKKDCERAAEVGWWSEFQNFMADICNVQYDYYTMK
ncbi:hypothetical protein DSL72_005237 [Monilinia vaccinii-corymbosi]|uniref:Uncharacterized protein n=1 Tax=Monilinia vaccinii-corymbosi TaxID=61207 RepID=A0A8A3PF28_9HELO|nr:hypothetical protein DSL72_005237 [Monilinia vaccinii-corymbosi]